MHIFSGILIYSYAKYWKQRLLSLPLEQLSDIFPVIQTNPETRNGRNVKNAWNVGPISVCIVDLPERYFLFSDSVPEDKDLREFLRMKRLVCIYYINSLLSIFLYPFRRLCWNYNILKERTIILSDSVYFVTRLSLGTDPYYWNTCLNPIALGLENQTTLVMHITLYSLLIL